MAANKLVRFGPVIISNSIQNLANPPGLTGGIGLAGINTATYLIINHVRIVNRTAAAAQFTLYIGASVGSNPGTEFMGYSTTVGANSAVDWYGKLRLDITDYLTGYASLSNTLTFEAEGEVGIA